MSDSEDITINPGQSLRELFPGVYVSADDLKGEDRVVTIEKCTIRDVGFPKERVLVAHFKETKKKLVLNKTNQVSIAALRGEHIYDSRPADWGGTQIILYPTTCRFGSDPNCPCIRIRDQ